MHGTCVCEHLYLHVCLFVAVRRGGVGVGGRGRGGRVGGWRGCLLQHVYTKTHTFRRVLLCIFSSTLRFTVNSVLGDTEQILNTLFIPIIIKASLMVNNENSHRSVIHPCDGALRSCKWKWIEKNQLS